MNRPVKYPVGQQSFEQIREGGYLYVDKTRYIEMIISSGNQYYFLGRPRRFGKSLFLATLKCFFEGKRDLFKDLYIDSIDWEWEPYPVLLFDLNIPDYKVDGEFEQLLENQIRKWETAYGVIPKEGSHSVRFQDIIEAAYRKTGKRVVILVDEYDKPLVNSLDNRERFERYRSKLASLYANFKSSADYIRLVFLTGVSRFGKLSVFSGLNNIRNISFNDKFAAICGITETEMFEYLEEGISAMAEAHCKSRDEIISTLKRRYDGYHFSRSSLDIYNPYSLLNTFEDEQFGSYWIETGTPSLLMKQLRRTNVDLETLYKAEGTENQLSGLDFENLNPIALFYQTGYLTIKGYDERFKLYQLGYPNEEVKEGFYGYILPYYTNLRSQNVMLFIRDLVLELEAGKVEAMMKRLISLFAGLSYELQIDAEKDVRNVLFLVFKLVGVYSEAEYHTSDGRIDILVRTPDYIYIMELKYDSTAQEALDQIKRKEYHLPWSVDNRQIIVIGISFSSEKRRIDDWKAERI